MRSHIKKSEPFIQAPQVFCHRGKIVVPEILVEKKSGSGNFYSSIWRYLLFPKINNSFSSFYPVGWEKFQNGASQSKSVSFNVPAQNYRCFETTLTYTHSRINRPPGANRKYGKRDGAGIERNKMSFDSYRIINSVSVTNFPVWEKAGVSAAFPEAKKDYIRTDTGKQPGSLLWINQDASVSRKTMDPMDRPMTSHKKPMISFEKNHMYIGSGQGRLSGWQALSLGSAVGARYYTFRVWSRLGRDSTMFFAPLRLQKTSPTNISAEGFFSNPGPEMIFLFSSGMRSASKGEQL